MTDTPIDKALCGHLRKYHQGQESAASSKELEVAFCSGKGGMSFAE